jgi:vancomycin permeability regulator SanA
MTLRKKIAIIIILPTLWFIGHLIYTINDGLTYSGNNADIGVVLGNKVNTDGTLSKRLEKRVECGLELYQQDRVKILFVSGGLGHEGFNEGDKMKEYLVNKGVPPSKIIVDNEGNNTIASVENTLKLQDSLNFKNVIVISQYYHLTRAKMLFKKRGFSNVYSASPRYFEIRDIHALIREFVAFYVQWVF